MIRFLKYSGLGLLLLVLLVGLWQTPYVPRYELPAKMCMDALSADQKTLVLLGPRFENDPAASARVYDVATGSLKRTITCDPSHFMLLSRDGSRLVTGDNQGHIAAWDTATGTKLMEVESLGFNSFAGARPAVSLDASGTRLAAAGRVVGEVRVWDLSQGKSLGPFPQTHPPFALSPDGRTLAAENGAQAIGTWSVDRGELLATFPAHSVQPSDVVFSPDGQLLASAANNGALFGRDQGDRRPSEIKLYNLAQGREQATADMPQADFAQLHFDDSGTTLTGTMTLLGRMTWHVEPAALRPLPLGLREQVVSADGALMAMTDGEPVNLVLVVGLNNQFLRIIDTATGKTRTELRLELPRDSEINPQVAPTAFSADGQTLWVHVTCRDTFWHRLGTGRYGELHRMTSRDLCGELWAVDVETQTVTARVPAQIFNVGLKAHLVEQGTLLLSRTQTTDDVRLAAWDVPPRRPIWLLALLGLLAAGVAGLLAMQIQGDLSAAEPAPAGFKNQDPPS